jgi:hypothetical protein
MAYRSLKEKLYISFKTIIKLKVQPYPIETVVCSTTSTNGGPTKTERLAKLYNL